MARVMGHVALGLCDGERPAALGLDADQLPTGSTVMVCPIGCVVPSTEQGCWWVFMGLRRCRRSSGRAASANSSWFWPGGWRR